MPGNRSDIITPTAGFLTSYDVKTGVEVLEVQYRWMIKLLAKLVNVWILPVLSTRCFHQWGGAKMMLRELHAWMKPGDFVYKTDIYSYYASINHSILIQQLNVLKFPYRHVSTIIDYCKRTILRIGYSIHCTGGIPKGGSLSPVLGALYLTPLDHAMERWMVLGDCFYARFQDDIILISRKRHVLKRMRTEMFQILRELQLCLRFEKTFVARCQKGFDLLGYHITPQSFSPSQKTQEKALENARRRYAQGGQKSLVEYLNRWRTWIYAGLPLSKLSVLMMSSSLWKTQSYMAHLTTARKNRAVLETSKINW
jgi:RNA-directed DNA polymerase